MLPKWITKTEVRRKGKKVSYLNNYNDIGLGYVIYDYTNHARLYIYKSAGNDWYEDISGQIKEFIEDNGKLYMNAVKNIGLI